MANLPETDENKNIQDAYERGYEDGYALMKEIQQTEQGTGGRGTAFLAGVLAAFFCILVFGVGWTAAQRGVFSGKEKKQEDDAGAQALTDHATLYKLKEIQKLIDDHYLEDVDGDTLSSYLFRGVAAGLDDPYASYYSKEELQSVLDESRGAYFGIGATIMLDQETGEHVVVEVYKGSPSETAGLLTGDVLLSIDGEPLAGVSLTDTVALIKEKEEPFPVEVYRQETDETLTLELACGEVELDYVEVKMLEDNVGYVSVSEFTSLAAEQFSDALTQLSEDGMEKLIVDLRGNPGGLLDSVLSMLGDILPKSLVVYTEDKNGEQEQYYTDGEPIVSCEVAVLVDGYSASASEIFAGAVQDLEVGPVVGEKTYGKGVVQNTYFLSDGSAVKFTTEKYFTPDGQDINGNGITPDVIIEEERDAKGSSTGTKRAEADAVRNETADTDDAKSAAEEEKLPDTRDIVLEKTMEVLRE